MHEEYDCPWQSASGAQSVTSPSRIEGFREFETDLSALFWKTFEIIVMPVENHFLYKFFINTCVAFFFECGIVCSTVL